MQQENIPTLPRNDSRIEFIGQGAPRSDTNLGQYPPRDSNIEALRDGALNEHKIKFMEWGFKIDRLFEVAYRFYRRNEGKAFQLSFDLRSQMNALVLQSRYGNFDEHKATDVGVLDLVGKRRRYEWSLLNGMSRSEAMSKFVCTLDEICPIFKAHAEAVKISSGLDRQLANVEDHNGGDFNRTSSTSQSSIEIDEQLKTIHSSLRRQTHNQFKIYAEKQHPNDTAKQKHLISSLQDQYIQQYISQMHPELRETIQTNEHDCNQGNSNVTSLTPPTTISNSSDTVQVDSSAKLIVNHTSNMDHSIDLHTVDFNQSVGNNLDLDEIQRQDDLNSPYLNANKDFERNNNIDVVATSSMNELSVQADISSEELNSNWDAAQQPDSNLKNSNENNFAQDILKIGTLNFTEANQAGWKQSSDHVESVKFYQNVELPPIGPFESFPEPKPIARVQQKSTPVRSIDPNLPKPIPADRNTTQLHSDKQTDRVINSIPPEKSQEELEVHVTQNCEQAATEQSNQPEENQTQDCGTQSQIVGQPVSDNIGDSIQIPAQSVAAAKQSWDATCSDGSGSPMQQLIPDEPFEPATIWSKKGVVEFKDSLADDQHGGTYEVKQGALVVIQVPTYPDGRYIYFEFVTDDYDIGFGVDFLHERDLVKPLALSIYEESEDEDEDYDDEVDVWRNTDRNIVDPELGAQDCTRSTRYGQDESLAMLKRNEKLRRQANTVAVLPTYRRDSHEEVITGRHKYPGRGYYLLRFDNTYSVLRSKTLYFRICYFM